MNGCESTILSCMDSVADVTGWISENEALLSGIAAMIVVAGVVFTPLGVGLRRVLGLRSERKAATVSGPPAPPAPQAAPSAQTPSIAVLPFVNMSDDSEQEFLADGMTEDIITGLSANRHLSVVSRNSTFAYKGQSPDIRQVGRELDVRYVLEGSVRRVGDRLRTTAQLIEAESGNHLWAEKYDRDYAEMFSVQDEVIDSITGALNAQITAAEFTRARQKPRAELGAWELVQRAMSSYAGSSPTTELSREITSLLRDAVAIDPNYGYAHSALAWMLFSGAINGFIEDIPAAHAEAEQHLSAALQGGQDDPLTLLYAGAAYIYSGRHEKGIRTLERSLALSPHQPDVLMHLGVAHGYLGKFDQAHAYFDRAEQMGPTGGMSFAHDWYRAIILGFEERYEEAVALIKPYLDRASRYGTPRVELGLDLAALGQADAARSAIERVLRDDPDLQLEGLALIVGAHPDPDKARERVALLREYWPKQ